MCRCCLSYTLLLFPSSLYLSVCCTSSLLESCAGYSFKGFQKTFFSTLVNLRCFCAALSVTSLLHSCLVAFLICPPTNIKVTSKIIIGTIHFFFQFLIYFSIYLIVTFLDNQIQALFLLFFLCCPSYFQIFAPLISLM